MAKQITLSQLRQASEKAKQYVDAHATAQVIRTETVLYSNGGGNTAGQTLTLSQSMEDFDELEVIIGTAAPSVTVIENNFQVFSVPVSDFTTGYTANIGLYNTNDEYGRAQMRFSKASATTIGIDTIKTGGWFATENVKMGIYKITGIKYTVPETYSTSEQIVGTWIDGRPLYQKTMTFTATSLVNDWQVFPHNISNVDIMLFDGQKINPTNGETYDVNYYHTTGSDTFWTASTVGKTNVYFKASTNQAGQTLIYTLKYTKTT